MGIRYQLLRLKDNWLLVILIIIMFFLFSGGFNLFQSSIVQPSAEFLAEPGFAPSITRGIVFNEDFAPDVEERTIIKTASMSTEVERGTFKEEEKKLKDIVNTADGFILNENVNKLGDKRNSYFSGNYQLRIELGKYDSVINQLKQIGEIQSFNENQQDITGRKVNLDIDLETEKARLDRFKQILDDAESVSDKITLNDRIFQQERRIDFLEESLKNIDQRVEFTTITITITEEKSEFAKVTFIKFSQLIKNLVDSVSNLVKLVFVWAPWALALWIIWFIFKKVRE